MLSLNRRGHHRALCVCVRTCFDHPLHTFPQDHTHYWAYLLKQNSIRSIAGPGPPSMLWPRSQKSTVQMHVSTAIFYSYIDLSEHFMPIDYIECYLRCGWSYIARVQRNPNTLVAYCHRWVPLLSGSGLQLWCRATQAETNFGRLWTDYSTSKCLFPKNL